MPKQVHIILHEGSVATKNTIDMEDKLAPVTTSESPIIFEALYLRHALAYLNRMIGLNQPIGPVETREFQEYLRIHSYLFGFYNNFYMERYATVRDIVASEEKKSTPSALSVWARFQKLSKSEAGANIANRRYESYMDYQRTQKSSASYQFDFSSEVNISALLGKLNITQENNNKSPEDYLRKDITFPDASPLMHVRQCEDEGCSLHPRHGTAEQAYRDFNVEINRFADRGNKIEKLVYVGFASGLLRRDMDHLQQLIRKGYTNITGIFVDPFYGKYISEVHGEPCEVSINEQIEIDIFNKGIYEFSTHLGQQLNDQSELHFFSSVDQVLGYLDSNGLKVNILISEDIFLDKGSPCAEVATPGAHRDFIKLKNRALATQGLFIELIKNDEIRNLYLHHGDSQNTVTAAYYKKGGMYPVSRRFNNREVEECDSTLESTADAFRY